jgi:hypothetical protein
MEKRIFLVSFSVEKKIKEIIEIFRNIRNIQVYLNLMEKLNILNYVVHYELMVLHFFLSK